MRIPVLFASVSRVFCVRPCWRQCRAAERTRLSYDGLQRRDSKVFEHLWVRKYFDVRSYHKDHLQGAAHRVSAGHEGTGRRPTAAGFPLTQRQKDSLYRDRQQGVSDRTREEHKFFQLTTEPGPDVLLIRGDLLDVVSFVPPDASGKGDLLQRAGSRRSNARDGTLRFDVRCDRGARARARDGEARGGRAADDRGRGSTTHRNAMGDHPARTSRRGREHSAESIERPRSNPRLRCFRTARGF